MKIVLHQWEISPYCRKIRKILNFKDLQFDIINYNGLRARHAAKLTEQGQLPVLEVDGTRIADSSCIAKWLEENYPSPPLIPQDSQERALCHFWCDWSDEAFFWMEMYFRFCYEEAFQKSMDYMCLGRPSYEKTLLSIVVKLTLPRKIHAQGLTRRSRQRIEAEFCEHLQHLNQILKERTWLVGETRTLADIAVSSQLDEMLRTSHMADTIRSFPRLSEWLDRNNNGH